MIELMTEWKEKFLEVELKNVLKNHFESNEGAQLLHSKSEHMKRSKMQHIESVDTVKRKNPGKIVED